MADTKISDFADGNPPQLTDIFGVARGAGVTNVRYTLAQLQSFWTIAWAQLSGIPGTFTPSVHAASHQNGGGDEINVAGLNGLLADDQNPVVHDILTKHNGFPGGTANFLRADGSFAAPNGGVPAAHKTSHEDGGSDEISIAGLSGETADAQKVTVRKNSGAAVGTRKQLNFIEGANITLTIADDAGNGEIDITITGSGGGSGISIGLALALGSQI